MDSHDNQPVAPSDAPATAPQAPSAGCSLSRKGFLKGAAAVAGAVAAGPLTDTLARVEAVLPAAPFAGVTVRCAFIGGGQYEIMYQSIPLWEKQTGAKVKIVYKGDGFAIDKKLRRRSSLWTGAACGHVGGHADPRRGRRAAQPDSGTDLRRGDVAACRGRSGVFASRGPNEPG